MHFKPFFRQVFHSTLACFLLTLAFQPLSAQKVVGGTVLLHQKGAPDSKLLLNAIRNNWKVKADSVKIADKTLTFSSNGGATVMIAYLDYPVAPDVCGAAARLSWLWKTAAQETGRHQAQMVISVIGGSNRTMDLYKLFTQVAAAVIETAKAPGILMEDEYLLLSGDYYLSAARNMVQNQTTPLYCWVYFGRPGGGNGFTLGLSEFGLPELEIAKSAHSEGEVHATLYDAAIAFVKSGPSLTTGQSLTTEEGTKLTFNPGKGTFLEDKKVLRLDY